MSEYLQHLPMLNACLNSTSAALLFAGWLAIKKYRNKELHGKLMSSAFLVSTLFLISYLTFHIFGQDRHYVGNGPEALKYPYYVMLFTHIVLAVAIVPMIIKTFIHAIKKDLPRHVKLGKITLAFWFYVSVTGVLIYLILYQHILGLPTQQ